MTMRPGEKMVADVLGKRLREAFPHGVSIATENDKEWAVAVYGADGKPSYWAFATSLGEALSQAAYMASKLGISR